MQNEDFAGIFSYEGWIDHIHFQKKEVHSDGQRTFFTLSSTVHTL